MVIGHAVWDARRGSGWAIDGDFKQKKEHMRGRWEGSERGVGGGGARNERGAAF